MNKMIILGNGFDLSHGLKTSFSDFIKSILRERIENPQHTDEALLSILNGQNFGYHDDVWELKEIDFDKSLDSLMEEIKRKNFQRLNWPKSVRIRGQYVYIRIAENVIYYHNNFLQKALSKNEVVDWVDFEKSYFKQLSAIVSDGNLERQNLLKMAKELNVDFNEVKQEFLKYLEKIVENSSLPVVSGYRNIFSYPKVEYSPLSRTLHERNMVGRVSDASRVLILNFNYTSTYEKYLDSRKSETFYEEINIHGELGSTENPPIFGYGDEMDPLVEKISDLDENELLTHFKSSQYTWSGNFRTLATFIESGKFNVDIIGHSCGLSDRVLLNYIFEHNHCDTIRILHHNGREGHNNTYMNISRHFSSEKKAEQRIKVLGYDEVNACPQLTD